MTNITGYKSTENASFFLTRVGTICAIGVATKAIPGMVDFKDPWFQASAMTSGLVSAVWIQSDRAVLADLASTPLDELRENPRRLSSPHGMTHSVLWDRKQLIIVPLISVAAVLAKPWIPTKVWSTMEGMDLGLTLAYGTVGLWHLCFQKKEV